MSYRSSFFPLLLLFALLAAHFNGLWGAFQFDDYNVIVNNSVVHSWAACVSDLPRGIRPLLKLTYTLNWTLSAAPFGFHLLNLSVHLVNTLLVYTIARRLFQSFSGLSDSSTRYASFTAALLFAVHPVQTEAVTYICGRSTSLMAMLYLASFLAYMAGNEEGKRNLPYHLLSPALFMLAIIAKETAVTLPAAILLWELSRTGRDPLRVILRRQWVHWLILTAVLAALVLHPNYGGLLLYSIETRTLVQNLLSQIPGISYLIGRLVLVHHLNIDPDLPVITHVTRRVILEGAGLLAAFAAAVAARKKQPVLTFGLLWFFLHLLPTNSFVPRLDIANERQLYLACFGLFLPIGYGFARFSARGGRRQQFCAAVIGLCAIALVAATIRRNQAYRSEITLWQDTAAGSPRKARVWNNLGYAYYVAGHFKKAREAYDTAVKLQPDLAKARNNLMEVEGVLKREAARQWLNGQLPAASGQ